jgi:hypothetical protein
MAPKAVPGRDNWAARLLRQVVRMSGRLNMSSLLVRKGFVAFLVLAVTEAERQATEGNEKVDLFKKAALTAVTFKR